MLYIFKYKFLIDLPFPPPRPCCEFCVPQYLVYCNTRSYYRKESAAVTYKVENPQPIILKLLIIHCMY